MVTASQTKLAGADLAAEIVACQDSFTHFLEHDVYIAERNPLGDVTGVIQWQMWDTHPAMLADLEEHRLIVLKARQLGWSWMLAARRVWEAMFTPHSLHGVSSAGELEASEFVWKCKFIISHLPWETLPTLTTENNLEIEFTASHGRILGFASTTKAGRGYTFTTFTADEAAFHGYAASNYAAYSSATVGQIVIVSSAGDDEKRAVTDWFQRMWTAGAKGENGYTSRFYGWSSRPGRDAAWYEAKRAELATSPGQLEREYPSTSAEAFRSMLLLRFDPEAIDEGLAWSESQRPLQQVDGMPSRLLVPYVSVWTPPRPATAYVLGIDGAEGKGLDYTVTTVLEARTLRQVAAVRERVLEPGEHGELTAALARWYNNAYCMVERSHGEAILAVLVARGCRVYRHRESDPTPSNPNPHESIGFPMTAVTRPGLIADFAQVIKLRAFSSPDPALWRELATFVVGTTGPAGGAAIKGLHDDYPMSAALAVRMASQLVVLSLRDDERKPLAKVQSRSW